MLSVGFLSSKLNVSEIDQKHGTTTNSYNRGAAFEWSKEEQPELAFFINL